MQLDKIAFRISVSILFVLVIAGALLYAFNFEACR